METAELVKFKVPKNTSLKSPVFVVSFSNGRLIFSNSNRIDFTSFINQTDERNDFNAKRILVANSDRLTYKGTTFEDENSVKKLPIRYVVGLRNTITGKMKLYECVFLHIKPIIKVNAAMEVISTPQTYKEKMDTLTMSFGNKAKKRAINARLKYSVDSSQSVNIIEDLSINESSPKQDRSLSIKNTPDYIPPQNPEAVTASEVYNIRDIISEEEDELLAKNAETLLIEYPTQLASWKNEGTYCKYVISHLEEGVDLEKAKYLLYYNYLVMFAKLGFSDFRKKDPIPSMPEPFKRKLLECYTNSSIEGSGKIIRKCPPKMKDKLFAYLFVLALIIDDYCVNIPLILEDLKRGLPSAINIAQVLGCHVIQHKVQDSVLKFAELKMPLFIPSTYRKKHF